MLIHNCAPFEKHISLSCLFLSLSLILHLSVHVLSRCINSEPILHHIALAPLSKHCQSLALKLQLASRPA